MESDSNGVAAGNGDSCERFELPAQTVLVAAHECLMSRYLAALEDVSLTDTSNSWAMRPAVRFVAQSHIRSKLKALSAVYVQLSEAAIGSYRNWLDTAAERTDAFANSLPAVQPARIAQRVPAVVAGVAAVGAFIKGLAKAPAVGSSGRAEIALALYGVALLAFGLLVYRTSFLLKREIFLRLVLVGPTTEKMDSSERVDVYGAEDAVFEAAGRAKPLESFLDLLIEVVPIFVAGMFLLIDPFHFTSGLDFWSQILPGAVAVLYVIIRSWAFRKEFSRPR